MRKRKGVITLLACAIMIARIVTGCQSNQQTETTAQTAAETEKS